MAIKASGSSLAFSEISNEFGDNDTSSLGGYRIRSGGATYPHTFPGNLIFSSLDAGIPTSGQIKFSDFYSKKLNMVVDFYSGGTELRSGTPISALARYNGPLVTVIGGYASKPSNPGGKKVYIHVNKTIGSDQNINHRNVALTRYNGNNVTIVGGYASRPSNPGGKKVYIHVNKSIGSDQNINHRNVALTTGLFDFATELFVHVGTSGKILGSGGKGGNGGSGGNNNGSNGVDGSSALGLLTAATIINKGRIQAGFGGGGGGAGRGQTVQVGKKSSTFRTSSGGGGGGGAGLPVGAKGIAGTGANWSSGSDGQVGQEQNSVDGGGGGQNAGAGGRSGGSDNTPTSSNAPNGGNSGGANGGTGGQNGYAIISTGGSAPTITGNAVVGRILTSATPV